MKRKTSDTEAATDESNSGVARWPLFGVGAAASLCCLVAAPAATGAAGVVGGGAAAAAGGGFVRIAITALTAGVLLGAVRWWTGSRDCECET